MTNFIRVRSVYKIVFRIFLNIFDNYAVIKQMEKNANQNLLKMIQISLFYRIAHEIVVSTTRGLNSLQGEHEKFGIV